MRAVSLATPKSLTISDSEGIASIGCNSPERILFTMMSASCRYMGVRAKRSIVMIADVNYVGHAAHMGDVAYVAYERYGMDEQINTT